MPAARRRTPRALPTSTTRLRTSTQGRYLAGIAAGMKINEMIEDGTITADQAKMGYVGAFPYAEVKSGMTSFYLGAKSVCPTVTMDVRYTNSWFDIAKEKEAATSLINDGCVVISQHADSEGRSPCLRGEQRPQRRLQHQHHPDRAQHCADLLGHLLGAVLHAHD